MENNKNQGVGIVWVVAAIAYVIVLILTDFHEQVVLVGAMLFALLAVTTPWWSKILTSRGL